MGTLVDLRSQPFETMFVASPPLPRARPMPEEALDNQNRLRALCLRTPAVSRTRRSSAFKFSGISAPHALCSADRTAAYASRPIGAFDSGVGGLSVLREVRRALPHEDLIYVADSAYCPYGLKPLPDIQERTLAVARYLVDLGAKLVVVACNSACVAGLDAVRQELPSIPIIGVEPAVKPAQAATRNGRIGVLATSLTLQGARFASLVDRFASDVDVFMQPAPGLVDLVEAGDLDSSMCRGLLNEYLRPLLEKDIDTLILGCTHYPFLRATIQEICGDGVTILDTGEPVARHVARTLKRSNLQSSSSAPGQLRFYTSGDPTLVQPVLRKLWDQQEAHSLEVLLAKIGSNA